VIDEQNIQTAEFEHDMSTRRKSRSNEKVESGVQVQGRIPGIPVITTSLVLQDIEDVDEPDAAAASVINGYRPDRHSGGDAGDVGPPQDVSSAWMEQNSRRGSTTSSSNSSPADDGFSTSSPTVSGAKETSGKRPALRLSVPTWDGFSFGTVNGTGIDVVIDTEFKELMEYQILLAARCIFRHHC